MLELPHTLIGAAIAVAIPNPAIALPLALASHFATDYIPHWNPHINTELKAAGKISIRSKTIILIDAGAALMLGTYIAATRGNFVIIMLACFLAVLPDVAEIPYYFLGIKVNWIEKLIIWQRNHQWNVRPVFGIMFQILVILLSLIVIYSHTIV